VACSSFGIVSAQENSENAGTSFAGENNIRWVSSIATNVGSAIAIWRLVATPCMLHSIRQRRDFNLSQIKAALGAS